MKKLKKLKKLNVLWIILGSIVFALFNILFFMTDMKESTLFSTWATYAFVVVSFTVFIATPFLLNRYPVKRKIFGLLSTEFGAIYFAVQLILGLTYILSGFVNYTPAFLIQISLLAAYAIVLIVNLIISEKAHIKNDHQTEDDE